MTLLFSPKDKLFHNLDALRAFESSDDTYPPVNVECTPTNYCNATCPWCWMVEGNYKQKHSKEWIDRDLLERTIREVAEMGTKAWTWTGGGDPSIYPGIDRMIDVAHEVGLNQGMFTNGYRPINHPEKLNWIRITVTEKFTVPESAAEYAKQTKVGVNFNLTNANMEYLRPMVEASKAAGVHYFQVRPALADRYDLQEKVIYPRWLMDYETESFKVVLTPYKFEDYHQPHGYPICHGHRLVPFIWHDGRVDVCAYHFKDAERYSFGNLYQNTFKEIWHGERRQKMLAAGVPVTKNCQHACYGKGTTVVYREESDVTPSIGAIEEVYELSGKSNVLLYSFDKDNGVSEWKPISGRLRQSVKSLLKLEINNCPTTLVTKDHPIDIWDNGNLKTIEARELKAGHYIPLCQTFRQTERSEFSKHYEDISYLFGYFLGDGSLTVNSKFQKSCHVDIAFGRDSMASKCLDRVKCEMDANKIAYKQYEQACTIIRIGRKADVSSFRSFFEGQKSHTKSIPLCLMDNSVATKRIIAGLIDTDGYVQNNSISIRLASKMMVEQIGLVFGMNGITYQICRTVNRQQKEERHYWEVSVCNRFDVSRIKSVFGRHSVKLALCKPSKLDASGRRRPRGIKFFVGDVVFGTVHSITEVPYGDFVYDFEVADNHTFLVNGRFFGNNCKLHESNKVMAAIFGDVESVADREFV